MIAVYCRDAERASSLARLCLAGIEVVHCDDWSRFERLPAQAQCSVIVIDRLDADPASERLASHRQRWAMHATVLVTSHDPGNARLVGAAAPGEVVWMDEAPRSLLPAITRAGGMRQLQRVGRSLASSPRVGRRLRGALVYACHAPRPVHTVGALVAEANCDRSTLCRQWQRAVPNSGMRLQDFLDWLLLLRAVAARAPGRGWAPVFAELALQERTLRRIAVRLTGDGLRDLDADAYPRVLEQFERVALAPLTGGGDDCTKMSETASLC